MKFLAAAILFVAAGRAGAAGRYLPVEAVPGRALKVALSPTAAALLPFAPAAVQFRWRTRAQSAQRRLIESAAARLPDDFAARAEELSRQTSPDPKQAAALRAQAAAVFAAAQKDLRWHRRLLTFEQIIAANFSRKEDPLKSEIVANNIGAALNLSFFATPDGRFFVMDMPRGGVFWKGSRPYRPDEAGYFARAAVVDIARRTLYFDQVPARFQKLAAPLEALLDYARKSGRRGELLAQLAMLRRGGSIRVDRSAYFFMPPIIQDRALPLAVSPRRQNILEPVRSLTGLPFWEVSLLPLYGSWGQLIDHLGGLVMLEGAEAVALTKAVSVRGIYRGFWRPDYPQGVPLLATLRHLDVPLNEAARFHFIEVFDELGRRAVVAVDGTRRDLRLFSAAN